MLEKINHALITMHFVLRTRTHALASQRNDRGDVPGWVLVAVMTAGLVTAIWLVADDALTSVFDRAMTSVSVRN
ncbi:MAG: hypothetical protein PHN51_03615 [Candidatus Nanopelagicales bacterium]|nr:hypothetical protein [Candidatus Nanopelagicales bacterium]